MEQPRVHIVHLRRPKKSNPNEKRSDPFWEYRSFGRTSCHASNLLNLKHAKELPGALLAFAQGGKKGFRLVYLTGPITVHPTASYLEVKWKSNKKPFRYDQAPTLVSNDGASDFPLIKKKLKGTNRKTLMGAFSSRYRSRSKELESPIAQQLIKVYEKRRGAASASDLATNYVDALPYPPNIEDKNRQKTYNDLEKPSNAVNSNCPSKC